MRLKAKWTACLFWGALWGLSEATLGFILHRASVALPGLPGFFMFPVAFFFMRRAASDADSPSAALMASVVAAAIKLADFLIPAHDAIRIINPALSILLEGAAVSIMLSVFSNGKGLLVLFTPFFMGVLWRGAFLAHLWLTSLVGLPAGLVTSGVSTALRFLFGESAINAVIIGAVDRYFGKSPISSVAQPSRKPAAAIALTALAVAVQLLI